MNPDRSFRARAYGGLALGAALLASFAGRPAAAAETQVTFVETFESGSNEGAWTFGSGYEYFLDANGNPGRYLRDSSLITFIPKASTSFGVASEFTGNYHDRGVTSLGIDLAVAAVDGNISTRHLALILLNDNGTPYDMSDDWGAFTNTELSVPPVGVIGLASPTDILQWVRYDIPVPSGAAALPDGWTWINKNYPRTGGPWVLLMRDVSHVGFILGDPSQLWPLFNWDVAMDNPRITTTTTTH